MISPLCSFHLMNNGTRCILLFMFFQSSGPVIKLIKSFTRFQWSQLVLPLHIKGLIEPFSSRSNSFSVIEGKAFRPKRWIVMPNCLKVSVPCMWWWNSRPRNSSMSTGLNHFFKLRQHARNCLAQSPHGYSIVCRVDRKHTANTELLKINPHSGCNRVNYDVCILREIDNGASSC